MIRIEGRNIGDEGFGGSNARDMDTGRMSSEAAKFLTETIKKAVQPIEFTKSSTNKSAISESSNQLVKTLEENTIAVQEFFVENSESTEEFKKLIQMMEASIEKTGDASVKSIQDAIKQIEKIKISSSDPEKANEILGLDSVKDRLGDNLKPETIGGRVFKKLTNVDLRTEKASQAFSAEKLFGLAPSKETQIERLEQTAREEAEVKAKGDAASTAVNTLTQASESTEASSETTKPAVTKNAEGGEAFKTGIDRESSDNKQVELLEAILAQLKDMGEMNSDGDDGLDLPGLPPGRGRRNGRRGSRNGRRGLNRSSTVKPKVKPKTSMLSRAGRLGRSAGRFARFAGPLGLAVTAGMAVADGVSGFTADENATTGQSFQNAGRNIMSGLTFGLVDSTQEKMEDGSYEKDRILEAAEDAGFYDKDYMGKSEIDKTKIQDASIPQLQAILEDDDLRSQDVKFVEELITKKQQSSVTPSVSNSTTSYSSDDAMQMGPGDVKEYDTRLEEINNSDMSETRKKMARRRLEGEYSSKFGGTPQQLEARNAYKQMEEERSVTPSVSTNKNENSNAVDPKLKELNEKAATAEIAYNENPTEENYKAMADATLKSDEYILESNVPNANALVNMSPSDPSRMLMTGTDGASNLEKIETSVTPTADAVGNMTEATSAQSAQSAPTVINNITNNNTSGSQSSPVMVAPTTSRNATNSFIDFQRQQYTRI